MAESTVVYTPDNNNGSVPAWLAMQNGGWGNGLGVTARQNSLQI